MAILQSRWKHWPTYEVSFKRDGATTLVSAKQNDAVPYPMDIS
ncbi:hypothetical protein V6N00_16405 [Tersicoccus sp. MR15.9]